MDQSQVILSSKKYSTGTDETNITALLNHKESIFSGTQKGMINQFNKRNFSYQLFENQAVRGLQSIDEKNLVGCSETQIKIFDLNKVFIFIK